MSTPLKILFLDDDPDRVQRCLARLREAGLEPAWEMAAQEAEYLALLDLPPDIILATGADLGLTLARALEILSTWKQEIPFFAIVPPNLASAGQAAMMAGATDYFVADRLDRLGLAVRRAVAHKKRLDQLAQDRAALKRQAQELDQMKSQFVANAFQELRVPIANLSLYLHLIKSNEDQREEHLAKLQDQVLQLNQLLQHVQNLAQLDVKKISGEFAALDLNEIVRPTVDVHRLLAEAAGLHLTFTPGADLPPINGDAGLLGQLVANLVVNAIQYTLSGKVEVRTYLQAVRREVCLEVQDTGPGISRRDMSHLFDRFFRGSHASQERMPGTGLGLAVAKEIAEKHGGRIDAVSEEGVGTTFTLSLPAIVEELAASGQNILVVENSHLMRKVLRETLELDGCQVMTAANGLDALEKMAGFKPDLILSDVVMPEMDGFAFFDQVRARPEWEDIPFIFVTGQSDQQEHLRRQSALGASYLIKPIVIEELLTAVRVRLSQK